MDILHTLARAFDEDKWWKYYQKIKKSKGVLRKYYALRFMRMTAKNGGYIGSEVTFYGKTELKHDLHGVHINRNAVIGINCQIGPGVIIGVRGDGVPWIGDNVYIGANAILIGPITVGDNAKIGAGAIIIDDVPAEATAVSLKATFK